MKILSDIQSILRQARHKAYQSVNLAMIQSYWLVGKRIVEDFQNGENPAEYGKSSFDQLVKSIVNRNWKRLLSR